jgi:hypothetical protein
VWERKLETLATCSIKQELHRQQKNGLQRKLYPLFLLAPHSGCTSNYSSWLTNKFFINLSAFIIIMLSTFSNLPQFESGLVFLRVSPISCKHALKSSGLEI